jgi:hypothetical protein
MSLWTVALLVFLLNLPFGYWRASVRKLSAQWFLAVLLPVALIIALIIFSGPGWKLITFPVLIGAFFLGKFVGGRLRNIIQGRGPGRTHH